MRLLSRHARWRSLDGRRWICGGIAVVVGGAGLFVVQAGGLDSSCAVNAFGIVAILGDRFGCAWGEVRYRGLSHDELTNEMMDGTGDEIWSLTSWHVFDIASFYRNCFHSVRVTPGCPFSM